MKRKTLALGLGALATIVLVSVSSAYITTRHLSNNQTSYASPSSPLPVSFAGYSQEGAPVDFTYAAEQTIHAVVHVKTSYTPTDTYGYRRQEPSMWEYFFGIPDDQMGRQRQQPTQQGSGSGVILSSDGYIVTNNHVVEKASTIEVTLNNRQTYKATVVGTDPSSDIALLKIDAGNLQFLSFGNSDNLKVGEWVLAVGNPFNLTSTVTAGIVSAKGRSLGIIPNDMKIESFIQTDAAVNPGNSGGALVNTRGELVGINTAIASYTGTYAGYSFAIPASIAKKVVDDLKQHGVVQRAMLGVQMTDLTPEMAKQYKVNTKDYSGALITDVVPESAAAKVGLVTGDIITAINDVAVGGSSDVQEQIALYRPNDKVKVSAIHNGELKHFDVVLRNKAGNTDAVKTNDELISALGASFKELSDKEKSQLNVTYGIQVTELKKGKLQEIGIKKDYIITRVNKTPVSSVSDLKQILSNSDGGVLIEGFYPNGPVVYYGLGL